MPRIHSLAALCSLLLATAVWQVACPTFAVAQSDPAAATSSAARAAAAPASEAPAAAGQSASPAAHAATAAPEQASAGNAEAHATAGHAGGHDAAFERMRRTLPLWSVVPFAALLLAIAILPLVTPHWWEHNTNKALVSVSLAVLVVAYLMASYDVGWHELLEKGKEYASFIILLGALYVISGGIYIRGSLAGTPLANTGLLALGTVLASFIGTTGASVLLIRPLLRANRSRVGKVHIVVFFIFLVSNCGGLLTPLGDPPLFLGFLKGVPFLWTFEHLWPQWLAVNLPLLAVFHVWDEIVLAREERARPGSQLEEVLQHEPVGVEGSLNVLFLAGIIATIYFAGRSGWPWGVQEGLMALLALAAYFTTPAAVRAANRFTFGPIVEVAVLFVGIFITMAPALQILNGWGRGERADLGTLGLEAPWQYFWATGLLSSFLDNAPTYLTLAATACGQRGVAVGEGPYLLEFLNQGPEAVRLLAAISCGAVFMGANTYIGNGPNFMVKAIAEENGVRMPSFFGYMVFSGLVLIPIFVLVTLVFFHS